MNWTSSYWARQDKAVQLAKIAILMAERERIEKHWVKMIISGSSNCWEEKTRNRENVVSFDEELGKVSLRTWSYELTLEWQILLLILFYLIIKILFDVCLGFKFCMHAVIKMSVYSAYWYFSTSQVGIWKHWTIKCLTPS